MWGGSLRVVVALIVMATVKEFQVGGEMASPEYVEQRLGSKRNYPIREQPAITPPPPHCRLFHLEYLARHGTRQPTDGKIETMQRLERTLQQYVAEGGTFAPDYQWMATWKNPFVMGAEGLLTLEGEREQYETGKRMRKLYESVLDGPYNPRRLVFQETKKSRAGRSASSYSYAVLEGKGTFGECAYAPAYIYSNDLETDRELRFFDVCQRYVEEVSDNKTAAIQYFFFLPQLKPNAHALSIRLGVADTWNITALEMEALWETCQAEAGVNQDYTHFCSIWTTDDVTKLEYSKDLESYWEQGYGHDINWLDAVDLFRSIFGNTVAAVDSYRSYLRQCGPYATESPDGDLFTCKDKLRDIPYQNSAHLRFAHAETLAPALAWLELFDTPAAQMKFDTPPEIYEQRLWRESKIVTLSSNVALAAYTCETPPSAVAAKGYEDILIKILHNEDEVINPACSQLYCTLDDVLKHYAFKLEVGFDELCTIET